MIVPELRGLRVFWTPRGEESGGAERGRRALLIGFSRRLLRTPLQAPRQRWRRRRLGKSLVSFRTVRLQPPPPARCSVPRREPRTTLFPAVPAERAVVLPLLVLAAALLRV